MYRWLIGLGFWCFAHGVYALDVHATMLSEGKALLVIDGKQQLLTEGKRSKEGVLLVSASPRQAVVEWQGQRKTLMLHRHIASQFSQVEKTSVSLPARANGHHYASGTINGSAVEFMVDTGATMVSMNYQEAERLGINYRNGREVVMKTANGLADAYVVTLDKVSVGNLELRQIEGVVSTTTSPETILLGNSYLGKIDLRIESGVMVLQQK